MVSNLDKYKKDLKYLLQEGAKIYSILTGESLSEFRDVPKQDIDKDRAMELLVEAMWLPGSYQMWYSEALVLIHHVLPLREQDFIRLYERPRTARKEITAENYVIEDALHGLTITRGGSVIADRSAAVPKFAEQLGILKSIERRFESSLFDIKQLVQADIFDSELEAAKELNKKGFMRGAGAIAGVVLEGHLAQVCENHKVKITKKRPAISDFNDKLKDAEVYDTPTWRKIQHLGDLRNLCDHKKDKDPTREDVAELIEGVEKVIKTLF